VDYQIITAIIAAGAAIAVAVISFYFNEKAKRRSEWQQKKFGHYQTLLKALSELAVDGKDKRKANIDFSAASNTVVLIASQKVVTSLMAFHSEVKWENQSNFSPKRHDELLQELILAIREDIGLSKKDDSATFDFHLIGTGPRK